MLITATDARSQLNESLKTDPNYIAFIEYINALINKALKNNKNYVRFQKHTNETYNEEIYKLLKSKNYTIHTDIEYIFKYDPLYETEMPYEKEMYCVYF